MAKLYGKLCGVLDHLQSPFLAVIRLYWGYQFFIAGKGKLFNLERITGFFTELGIPYPHLNATVVGVTECVGGLLLMVGLASRLASIPLVIAMSVAYVTAHRESLYIVYRTIQGWSFSLDEVIRQEPYTFLMAAFIVMIFGPGKFSIDYLLQKKFGKDWA